MVESHTDFLLFASARLKGYGIRLRRALPEDLPIVAEIYASTRAEELQQVPWDAEQKKSFTDWQSAKQEEHYALHYPLAERLLIEAEHAMAGESVVVHVPLGRIYVDTTAMEVRLMDITLLPGHRQQGVGTRIVNELLRYADGLQRQASLHVEPFNPAKRMYERMDFKVVETRGLYEFMVRDARAAILGGRKSAS